MNDEHYTASQRQFLRGLDESFPSNENTNSSNVDSNEGPRRATNQINQRSVSENATAREGQQAAFHYSNQTSGHERAVQYSRVNAHQYRVSQYSDVAAGCTQTSQHSNQGVVSHAVTLQGDARGYRGEAGAYQNQVPQYSSRSAAQYQGSSYPFPVQTNSANMPNSGNQPYLNSQPYANSNTFAGNGQSLTSPYTATPAHGAPQASPAVSAYGAPQASPATSAYGAPQANPNAPVYGAPQPNAPVAENTAVSSEGKHAAPKRPLSRSILEFVLMLAGIFAVVWLLHTFVFQPFRIPSGSMEDTIMTGDMVIAEKISYYFREPQAGDIVVFEDSNASDKTLIKRCIAVAGQTVNLVNGKVVVDGQVLNEPYTDNLPSYPLSSQKVTYPYTVPSGCIWVMGDNRTNSADSREFGAVRVDTVIARGVLVYWPIEDVGILS